MPSGRDYSSIALSREETLSLIDSEVWMRIASIDSAGKIWNLPTHFVRLGDAIYFDEDPDSMIVSSIGSEMCATIDSGYSYDDVKGVILRGPVRIVEDSQIAERVAEGITNKYAVLTSRSPLHDLEQRKIVEFRLPESPESLSWSYGKRML